MAVVRSPRVISARWLLAPAVLYTIALIAFPVGYTLWLSLHEFTFGRRPLFNAGANFLVLAADPVFWHGMLITLELFVLCLALQLALGLYVAMLLNRPVRARPVLRTILMSPFMTPSVVVGLMWLVILDPSLGAANYILESLGLPRSLWLASPEIVVPVIALVDTWQWTPFMALIILGGLQTLPVEPYEAAWLDGATRGQIFWHITLPMLRPTLCTAAILRSVDLLRFFDLIYLTTQGGPGNASTSLNIYAYKRGFEFFDIGYASAIMLVLLSLVLIIVAGLTRWRRAAW